MGLYPESKKPGEIFITIAKQGSTLAGMMDAFATSVSIALQYGVPLEDLCRKFSHMRFEPSGFTNNKQIPIAKSMMDYIFRYLAIKFLDKEVETADPEAVDPNQAAAEEVDRSGPAADASQGELNFGTMDAPTEGPEQRADRRHRGGLHGVDHGLDGAARGSEAGSAAHVPEPERRASVLGVRLDHRAQRLVLPLPQLRRQYRLRMRPQSQR